LHLARGERPGQFQQAVGQRGFAVVDMRDDRKVADGCGVASCQFGRIETGCLELTIAF
jgi:hypothetical protein